MARLFIPHYLFTNNFESLNDARDRGTFPLEFDHISPQFSLKRDAQHADARGKVGKCAMLAIRCFCFHFMPNEFRGNFVPDTRGSESSEAVD